MALATRGGYGLTRLLDRIDWKLIAKSVERGTRWVGQSDLTALQLGLLAHGKAITWAGPLACDDFGGEEVDDITEACFLEAMSGELEAVGFRTEPGFDGLQARGTRREQDANDGCRAIGGTTTDRSRHRCARPNPRREGHQ